MRVPRSSPTARAIDKYGAPQEVQQRGQPWQLNLAAAGARYAEDPPGCYFIGGDPAPRFRMQRVVPHSCRSERRTWFFSGI